MSALTRMIFPESYPRSMLLGFLLVLFLPLLLPAPTYASEVISAKLLSQIITSDPTERIPVIIQLPKRRNLSAFATQNVRGRRVDINVRAENRRRMIQEMKQTATEDQHNIVQYLHAQNVKKLRSLWINNSISTRLTADEIEDLSTYPGVELIRLDETITLPRPVPADYDIVEDNVVDLNVLPLWDMGLDGQGMVIAVLDSGVDYYHADLQNSWRGGNNSWLNAITFYCDIDPDFCGSCDLSDDAPCDFPQDGVAHGTATTSLIVGGDAGGTSIGVAPGAQWIAAKVFSDDGLGLVSSIHAGFEWVLDPDGNPETDDAPDIVNNSWGLSEFGVYIDEYRADIQALEAAGIGVVFSAGNDGPDPSTDSSPGNYPEALSVGALGTFSSPTQISSFSSRGPSSYDGSTFPDVVAPGLFVKVASYTYNGTFRDSYDYLSGTSFSAPQVSGVMALLRQAFPQTPVVDIQDALKASASDLGPLGPDNDYGYGRVNALGAYDWLLSQPNIALADPTPPADDHEIDFGTVAAGTLNQKTLYCSNSGRGELRINDVYLSSPEQIFQINLDECSGAVLTQGEQCQVILQLQSGLNGSYTDGLKILSSDLDDPEITVSLSGTIEGGVAALPEISFLDSILPERDRNLPFGTISVGNSRNEFLQITNLDLGVLLLDELDTSRLPDVFSLTNDGCSGAELLQNELCTVEISFSATDGETYSGQIGVPSNDPDSAESIITLSGKGNNPPPAPILISPTAGASLTTTAEFTWQQEPDPDNEPVTNYLYVSESPDFSAAAPIVVQHDSLDGKILPANLGGILLIGGLLSFRSRKKIKLSLTLLFIALLFSACGGGGGSSETPIDDEGSATVSASELRSYTITGLLSGRVYYWKVVAEDAAGETGESAVSSFMTN